MKKVLIITYYFPPAGGAGVQRWLKFVKYLPQYGCEPIVLTVDGNCASYPQKDASLAADIPSGLKVVRTRTREILSAYKKISPQKQIPYGGFANEQDPGLFQKIARFIRGNFFLPDPRKAWNRFALPAAVSLIENENIGTVITTGPPHSTHLVGLKLKKLYPSLKWIADLRDPWTDIYYNEVLYQGRLAKRMNLAMERKVLNSADVLVTVSEGVKRNFCSHAPVEHKFHVIPNGYDAPDFADVPVDAGRENPRMVISYIGTLSPLYDSSTFTKALKLLPAETASKILIRIIGSVNADVAASFSGTSAQVEYLPYQPHGQAIRYMVSSDLLLLLLPVKNSDGVLTGKFFEYLASRRPILLIQPEESEAGKMILRLEAGAVFDSGNADGLAKYLAACTENKPSVAVDDLDRFSREHLAGEMAKLIHGI